MANANIPLAHALAVAWSMTCAGLAHAGTKAVMIQKDKQRKPGAIDENGY